MCGFVEEDFLEVRHRILALEESLAQLAKWTNFNLNKQHENTNGTAEDPVPVVVDGDGVANSGYLGDAAAVENVGSLGRHLEDDIDIEYKVEVDENYEEQDNLQETSSGPPSPILGKTKSFDDQEAISQIFRAEDEIWQRRMDFSVEEDGSSICSGSSSSIALDDDDDDEDWMPPTKSKSCRCVVNQSKKVKGKIPPRRIIETDVCQSKVEGSDDSQGYAGTRAAQKKTERLPKSISPTASKFCYINSKSLYVSLERLPNSKIQGTKNKKGTIPPLRMIETQEVCQSATEVKQGDYSEAKAAAGTGTVQEEATSQRVVDDETIEFRMDDKEKDDQVNSNGNDDKEETADDPAPPTLEAVSSIEPLNESTECEKTPQVAASGTDSVQEEATSQRMIVVDDETIGCCKDKDEQLNATGTSDDLLPPILEAVSPIEPLDENTEYEMPSLTPTRKVSDVVWPSWPKLEQDSKRDSSSGDSSIPNESSSSIELHDEDDEGMPPKGAVNGRIVVNQSENREIIPLPTMIETDGFYQTEGSAVSTKEQKRRATRKKLLTAKKTSFKRLPNSRKKKPAAKSVKWKCPHCSKTWISKSQLETHIRSHTGERPFLCPHCPQGTTQAGTLRSHIRRFHSNLSTCTICQKKFSFQKTLEEHMKIHDGLKSRTVVAEVPSKCPHCRYRITSESLLKAHIRKFHSNACQRALAKLPSALESRFKFKSRIQRRHSNPQQQKHSQKGHRNIHPTSGSTTLASLPAEKGRGRPLKKAALPPSALESRFNFKSRIQRRHSNVQLQKPSQKGCGRPLKKKGCGRPLKIQKKKVGKVRCYFCSKTPIDNWHLEAHLRIHTGEKPFNCPICPYASNQEGHLKNHLKKHIKK